MNRLLSWLFGDDEPVISAQDVTHAGEKYIRALERHADAMITENVRLREALRAVTTAWVVSWDCAANPGHRTMNDAVVTAVEILGEKPAYGKMQAS